MLKLLKQNSWFVLSVWIIVSAVVGIYTYKFVKSNILGPSAETIETSLHWQHPGTTIKVISVYTVLESQYRQEKIATVLFTFSTGEKVVRAFKCVLNEDNTTKPYEPAVCLSLASIP